jgi:ribosome biogenesis GTPase
LTGFEIAGLMPEQSATVIAAFGRRMRVRFADGESAEARIKGKTLRPVCGDGVRVRAIEAEEDWLITAVDERRNALTRPNSRGATEVLAANIDVLITVAAPSPQTDWYIVDRYLCAAELMSAQALLVWNKSAESAPRSAVDALAALAAAGYEVLHTDALSGTGMDRLHAAIGPRTAILVGQSGVGKSTLINRMSHPSEQKTADLSRKSREGRHTTVSSVMLPLAGGGAVIDSPGVRDFAPVFPSQRAVEFAFREIHEQAEHCRFGDCLHLREPYCSVRFAVESGTIDARRYESYRRALRLQQQMSKRPR